MDKADAVNVKQGGLFTDPFVNTLSVILSVNYENPCKKWGLMVSMMGSSPTIHPSRKPRKYGVFSYFFERSFENFSNVFMRVSTPF